VKDYMELLASTGEAPAADLAARFGIDIRTRKFWEDSLKVAENGSTVTVNLSGNESYREEKSSLIFLTCPFKTVVYNAGR